MSLNLKDLLQQLDDCEDAYRTGEGIIPDSEFDALVRLYEEHSGKSYTRKYTKSAPLKRAVNKVKLPHYMGSVNSKIKGADAQVLLDKYTAKYPGPWIVADKLDGNGGQYSMQGLTLYTKGDGFIGEDISTILPYLNLPTSEKNIILRGELIIPQKVFPSYAEAQKAKGSKNKYTSIRSAGSGILGRESYNREDIELFDFVAFQIQNETLSTHEHYTKLQELGFKIPNYKITTKLVAEELFEELKQECKYERDGLVISPAYTQYAFPQDKNPKHMIAFKVDVTASREVLKVEWNASPKGLLIPTVYYEPVVLDKALCTKAKAHNAKFIYEHGIGPGSYILVTRAGNIVPQVIRGITRCEEYQLPEIEYEWDDTKTNFIVVDPDNNTDVQIRRIVHFVSSIKIDGLSRARVATLYESGINTISLLLTASIDDIASCNLLGIKSATKIRQSIDNAISSASLPAVMMASNIFGMGFGLTKLTDITDAYPNILEYAYADTGVVESMLLEIGGFAKLAVIFEDKLPLFVEWLEQHPQITLKEKEIIEEENNILEGEHIVFTGFTDTELADKIKRCGGNYSKTVSGKTTILVAKDLSKLGGKANKIKSSARILSLEQFKEEYSL